MASHRWRNLLLCASAVMIALAVLHLLQGPRTIPLSSFIDVIANRNHEDFDRFVILFLRLPRILAVAIAGAALGAAGYLLQTAMRNRLGEPQILGLNAGASLAVVLLTTYPLFPMPDMVMPLVASLGAGIVFGLVLMLSTVGTDRFDPARMVFFGIALSALANAIVSAILILDEDTLEQLRFWLVGDSAGASYPAIIATAPAAALGLMLACLLMPALSAFTLGETLATTLGASVRRTRLAALAVTALLCGAAVSLVGPIGFIGLMAPALWPHLHHRPSVSALLLVALSGAALLLTADILAVGLLAPIELPTGAVTGLAGAPVFIWMVTRKRL